MLRFEIDQSGYRPPSKERFRQSSMWIYAFLFGSLMVDGDTLLPHSASVTFPPRAGRICQPIHLNESLSRAAFTAAIPLNDCSLKGDALELGHLEGDISGSGGEIAVVVAAAIPLTLLITLILPRLAVQSSQAWFAVSFRMVCRNFILPEFCKPCLFLFSSQFAKLIVHYLQTVADLCTDRRLFGAPLSGFSDPWGHARCQWANCFVDGKPVADSNLRQPSD